MSRTRSQSLAPKIFIKAEGGRGLLAWAIATVGGAGLSPVAPGTVGSLVALPLIWTWGPASLAWKLAFLLAIALIGTWAAGRASAVTRTSDHGSVVIDEVLGQGIALLACTREPELFVIGFLAFRFFDVLKLPPVHLIDRWSKQQSLARGPFWAGFGIMADDILAGLQALIATEILRRALGFQ
jgi:phosphatidylglycerophosphatase A